MASNNRGDGFFVSYGKALGDRLSQEASARGISRTELLRRATEDYLARNPKPNH